MYHSSRMTVNILDVSRRARQLRPRTTRSGTCDPNHHGIELVHRARTGIREAGQDMRARREPDLWLSRSVRKNNNNNINDDDLMDKAPETGLGSGEEREAQPKAMRWPCNHRWGKWACNSWVNTMGAKCQDCKNRKDMDSTPTHTRLAHMYDLDVIVEGFRNAGLNAACIVEMLNDGASEQALHDALSVIQENDAAWHYRVEHVVLHGIGRWNSSKKKA
ncbi:hypothetical protein ACJ41O_013422 [Fusarium nematophilum]